MTNKNNLPTPDQCRRFFERVKKEGECWHEYEGKYKCSCGQIFCIGEDELIVEHLEKSNPTYSHADEILAKMREKLGEERLEIFLRDLIDRPQPIGILGFVITFILNPSALIDKASEWMEEALDKGIIAAQP